MFSQLTSNFRFFVLALVLTDVTNCFTHRKNLAYREPAEQLPPASAVEAEPDYSAEETVEMANSEGFASFLQWGQPEEPEEQSAVVPRSRPGKGKVATELKPRRQPSVVQMDTAKDERMPAEAITRKSAAVRKRPALSTKGVTKFRGQLYQSPVPLSIDPGLVSRWNLRQ